MATVSERYKDLVRMRWNDIQGLVTETHNEMWKHGDEVDIGEDYDDQVADGRMVGAFVATMRHECATPEEFIEKVETILLDREKIYEWWWGGKYPS